ncbi:unnamed protein product [Amoebophrya sp. A120]|nr:unnamed protein product [Amoebophrya sp. A120]|eukprot:GSA120T00024408001.1
MQVRADFFFFFPINIRTKEENFLKRLAVKEVAHARYYMLRHQQCDVVFDSRRSRSSN